MRVLTYNIAGNRGRGRPAHLEQVADLIRGLHADVVGLQEVIHAPDIEAPEEALARMTGMHACYMPAHQGRSHVIGNAVLCREPIADIRFHELPGRFPERRVLLEVESAARGRRVTVFNTHLVHLARAGSRIRHRQAVAVAERMQACNLPYVLMGDLNASPYAPELEAVRSVSPDSDHHRELHSWPARRPFIQYDHIWPGPGWEVTRARILALHVSDHRPVLAELRWHG